MIPKDPVILLSFVNTKLRDFYDNPCSMCEDLEIDLEELSLKLASAGYHYNEKNNQFE